MRTDPIFPRELLAIAPQGDWRYRPSIPYSGRWHAEPRPMEIWDVESDAHGHEVCMVLPDGAEFIARGSNLAQLICRLALVRSHAS